MHWVAGRFPLAADSTCCRLPDACWEAAAARTHARVHPIFSGPNVQRYLGRQGRLHTAIKAPQSWSTSHGHVRGAVSPDLELVASVCGSAQAGAWGPPAGLLCTKCAFMCRPRYRADFMAAALRSLDHGLAQSMLTGLPESVSCGSSSCSQLHQGCSGTSTSPACCMGPHGWLTAARARRPRSWPCTSWPPGACCAAGTCPCWVQRRCTAWTAPPAAGCGRPTRSASPWASTTPRRRACRAWCSATPAAGRSRSCAWPACRPTRPRPSPGAPWACCCCAPWALAVACCSRSATARVVWPARP